MAVNSTVTSDKLVIQKSEDGKAFTLSRHIEEVLTKSDIKKRMSDIENEKKRLDNERAKAFEFIKQANDGIAECDAKLNALQNALDNGYGEM